MPRCGSIGRLLEAFRVAHFVLNLLAACMGQRDFSTLSRGAEPPLLHKPKTPFDSWTIEEAAYQLDLEVQRIGERERR